MITSRLHGLWLDILEDNAKDRSLMIMENLVVWERYMNRKL